jgi:uncharacterized protein
MVVDLQSFSVMRWDKTHQSDYVDDRRGQGVGGAGLGGGLGLLLPIAARFGWKGLLVAGVVFLIVRQTGTCTSASPGGGGGAERGNLAASQAPAGRAGEEDELARFVGFVFDDVQKTWSDRFARVGDEYRPSRLVLFTDAVATGCGTAPAEVGPFYCPRDGRVYIDLSFYRELRSRFGATGDFAQAYVIAHEVGHHVEGLRHLASPDSKKESIEYELLADCLAGVWANEAEQRGLLEAGDLDEALGAASAIGDDRIQKQTSGQVNPETWTHGSSAERREAFQHGFSAGSKDACGLLSRAR